jgi:putative hemolysin
MYKHPEMAVDLERIIAARAKGKKIPRFVVNALKKLVHQDFLNAYLTEGYEGVEFCENCLKYLDVTVDVVGMEHLDTSGQTRYTFVSNHPLGGIDGVALGGILGRAFDGKVKYLVNDLLMNLKGLAPLCVPINKIGGQARNLPALVDEAFASEDQMIMFPAGSCSRKIDGKIQDRPWTKTFIQKSAPNGRRVVPIHFIGRNSNRFYRVDRICKLLGIKFNLAMLFLPDELYRGQHSRYKVIIGEPFPLDALDSSRTAAEWAQWVREKVYELE